MANGRSDGPGFRTDLQMDPALVQYSLMVFKTGYEEEEHLIGC